MYSTKIIVMTKSDTHMPYRIAEGLADSASLRARHKKVADGELLLRTPLAYGYLYTCRRRHMANLPPVGAYDYVSAICVDRHISSSCRMLS